MTAHLGALTGMRFEAELLPRGFRVACSAAEPGDARALARKLLADGAEGLISFGMAGGLDPELAPGSLIIATEVRVDGRAIPTAAGWRAALAARLPTARLGPVAASETVLETPMAKADLFVRTGAVAVDMESGAVAEACAEAGRPFAVLRAIADPGERRLPPAALAALDCRGEVRPLWMARSLLRRPGQLFALLRLAADGRRALRALAIAAPNLEVLLRS